MAVVSELESAGVPQHVGMNGKGELRSHARPSNHALISGCGKRCATFRDKDLGRCWCFAQELAQCSAFPGRYRMHAGIPAFGPAYVQASGSEVDVVPPQRHDLRGSEAVAVVNQDSGSVRCPDRFCLAASMSRSTSRSVRYSRLRLSTVTFTEVGADFRSRALSMEINVCRHRDSLQRRIPSLRRSQTRSNSDQPARAHGGQGRRHGRGSWRGTGSAPTGPYASDRQWGTFGAAWDHLPHDHARRAPPPVRKRTRPAGAALSGSDGRSIGQPPGSSECSG